MSAVIPSVERIPFGEPVRVPTSFTRSDAIRFLQLAYAPLPCPVMLLSPDIDPPGPIVLAMNAMAEERWPGVDLPCVAQPLSYSFPSHIIPAIALAQFEDVVVRQYFGKGTWIVQAPCGSLRSVVIHMVPVIAGSETLAIAVSFQSCPPIDPSLQIERLTAVTQLSQEAALILQPDATICFASDSAERILGYSVQELVGRSLTTFLDPDDQALLCDRLSRLDDRPSSPWEFTFSRQTGPQIQIEAVGKNLSDHPAIGGLLVQIRDVTEKRLLEDRFRHSQKMEALGQLAGGIAHDFNNLLTVILGNLSLVRLSENDPNQTLIQAVAHAAIRAGSLTQKLLGFSRKRSIQFEEIDLDSLYSDLISVLRRTIDPRIQMKMYVDSEARTVWGDVGALQQVLMNLCLNSRDAMPHGGVLTLSAQRRMVLPGETPHPECKSGEYILLSVTDTGIGIPSSIRDRIFEPFFTTKEAGKGTGLGLPMVYSTIRQHRGWIEVHSTEHVETRFDLYLPWTNCWEESRPIGPDTMIMDSHLPEHATVLVVDDEESVRTVSATILQMNGYKVHMAADAESALQSYESAEGQIDAVVLDLNLSGRSGSEVISLLRSRKPDLRFLLISGSEPDPSLLSEGIHFLPKPYTVQNLLEGLRRLT